MRFSIHRRLMVAASLCLLLLVSSGVAQPPDTAAKAKGKQAGDAKAGLRAYPRVAIGTGRELEYVGMVSADGKYKPLTKFGRYVDTMKTASVPDDPNAPAGPETLNLKRTRPAAADRRSNVVQDFQPPKHAVAVAKGSSFLKDIRDVVLNFVNGPESIFEAPQSVTTDSRQRVLITDPDAHAVHVLDSRNKTSFSIIGGKDRRLQSPNGIAVDSEDNIYVSDYDVGMVLVYDPEGRFLRYIGAFKDESQYEGPAGIAIDRKSGRIYLIDRPRNMLFVLDLQGNELKRFGKPVSSDGLFALRKGSGAGRGEFTDPVEVVIHNDELIVLDAGSRLQIFDLQGHFRRQFSLSPGKASGLCVDSEGIFYLSREDSDTVEAYGHDGQLLTSFGRSGNRYGEFDSPAGLWADQTDRLYIVDSDNLRLQIFKAQAPKQSSSR